VTERRPELRLALGMRGGVSLAVWIGGACAEIDELRRAVDEKRGFWWDVLSVSPYSRVVVDVMAGASAGGLNGVLFAAAIRHGFTMSELQDVWTDVAAVDRLRRQSPPWISLFDGDLNFLDVIRDRLIELVRGATGADRDLASVDLQLSATLVEPIVQSATSPRDEKLRRRRSDARFHFRHDPGAALPRQDLEEVCIPHLAVAARATASFPGAFEAAVVRSRRPPEFSSVPGVPEPAAEPRLADCHGFFSESRGARPGIRAPETADFVVADGGIVDNIPLGKAFEAIRDAPADGPTKRVLVYMHPTGPATGAIQAGTAEEETDEQQETRRRGPSALASGLMAGRLQSESIDSDLERIAEHNNRVSLGALLRRSLLDELGTTASTTARATTQIPAYAFERGGADADGLHRLLRDPVVVLGEDPFPYLTGGPDIDDRWRTPLSCWPQDDRRQSIDVDLRTNLTGRLRRTKLGTNLLCTGLGPSIRCLRLLIELVREAEKQSDATANAATLCPGGLGAIKKDLYELSSLMRSIERIRHLGWVVATSVLAETNAKWIDATLSGLDRLLQVSPDEASAILASRAPKERPTARESYFAWCDQRLQEWSTGTVPGEAADGVIDVRSALVGHLHPIVGIVLTCMAPVTVARLGNERHSSGIGAEVIRRVLVDRKAGTPPTTADELGSRLAALEVLLVHEQLLGDPGAFPITFERMSAAAETAGASRFTKLHEWSAAIDPDYTDDNHLLPNVKLAGNELGSFSAFLEKSWRDNDWVWGRMDAVPTLVDLMLGEDPGDAPGLAGYAGVTGTRPAESDAKAVRLALIRRRQDEIYDEAVAGRLKVPKTRDKWVAGLEDLTHPGSPSLAKSVGALGDVAGSVIGEALPPTFPPVTRQLRAVLRVLARRFATPRGGLPPLPGSDPDIPPSRVSARLVAVAALLGVLAAAVLWALAASVPAFVIGILFASAPGGLLLWLALQRKPKVKARRKRLAASVPGGQGSQTDGRRPRTERANET